MVRSPYSACHSILRGNSLEGGSNAMVVSRIASFTVMISEPQNRCAPEILLTCQFGNVYPYTLYPVLIQHVLAEISKYSHLLRYSSINDRIDTFLRTSEASGNGCTWIEDLVHTAGTWLSRGAVNSLLQSTLRPKKFNVRRLLLQAKRTHCSSPF